MKIIKSIIVCYSSKYTRINNNELLSIYRDFTSSKGICNGILSHYYRIIFLFHTNKPLTKKGILVRMGKGKGKIYSYIKDIKPLYLCALLIPKPFISKTSKPVKRNVLFISNKIISLYLSKLTLKYPYLSFSKLS